MKILFVLDSLRDSYYTADHKLSFSGSKTGQNLINRIISPKGLNIKMEDVGITWAYNAIPPKNGDGSLKPITKSLGKEQFKALNTRIVENKPDIVVPMGGTATLSIFNKKSITSMRGIPLEHTFIDEETSAQHDCWVLPMLSLDSVWRNPSNTSLIDTDFLLLKDFIDKGDSALQGDIGTYNWIENFDEAVTILKKLIWNGVGTPINDVIAVDYETNTTNYWYKGAKLIMFSASWQEGQGIAIPLDHVLFRQVEKGVQLDHGWTHEQLLILYGLLNDVFSSQQRKVLANGKFDIAFMKYTTGLKKAVNCIDIQDMHYIAISEESGAKVSRVLKVLAHQYTTMGGYEKALNDAKDKILRDHQEAWIESQEALGIKPKKKDYQPRINEVDGSSFSYEWIPIEILKPYASGDTDATLRIYYALDKLIRGNKQWEHLAYTFYPQLEDALTDLEVNGARVDVNKAKELKQRYVERLTTLKQQMIDTIPEVKQLLRMKQEYLQEYLKMRALKPKDRYPNGESDKERYKQLGKYYSPHPEEQAELLDFKPTTDGKEVLYGLRGVELPIEKEYFTDSFIAKFSKRAFTNNISTIEDAVEWKYYKFDIKIALPYVIETYDDDFAKLMVEYSGINKVVTTYIDQIPTLSAQDGYVHTKFNPRGTVTSRLSSNSLNMQNIPRRTSNVTDFSYDNPIKQMFVSRFKNGTIINCDFTSLEVYISALISNDKGLIQSLLDGKDIHKDTASKAWGVPYDDVDPEMRKSAKAVIFG